MKRDIQRIMLAAVVPLFLIFILFLLKFMEVGMDWDFSHMGVYPMEKRGIVGIFTHPLIHSGFSHLLANTLPLFFLSWCLFYFYRGIAGRIFMIIWIGAGLLTFMIGKPGWHIGASGLIYGLAFFLFFQWHPAQICSSDRYFTACHLPVRRNHLAYVSLFLSRQHVMGRTSQRRNHGNTLCIRFLEPRASTTGTFLQTKRTTTKKKNLRKKISTITIQPTLRILPHKSRLRLMQCLNQQGDIGSKQPDRDS